MIDFGSRTWPLLVLAAGDEPRQFLLLMGQQTFGSTPFFSLQRRCSGGRTTVLNFQPQEDMYCHSGSSRGKDRGVAKGVQREGWVCWPVISQQFQVPNHPKDLCSVAGDRRRLRVSCPEPVAPQRPSFRPRVRLRPVGTARPAVTVTVHQRPWQPTWQDGASVAQIAGPAGVNPQTMMRDAFRAVRPFVGGSLSSGACL